jgi:hypothetical protein
MMDCNISISLKTAYTPDSILLIRIRLLPSQMRTLSRWLCLVMLMLMSM